GLMGFDRKRSRGIEQGVTAGFQHPNQGPVPEEQSTLPVLDRYAQHERPPAHNTSPYVRHIVTKSEGGLRTRASRGRGGPGIEPGGTPERARFVPAARSDRIARRQPARAISAQARGRSHGVRYGSGRERRTTEPRLMRASGSLAGGQLTRLIRTL